MRRVLIPVAAVALAISLVVAAGELAIAVPAQAQGIAVTNSSAESRFPDGVLFRLAATSDSPITEARLRYKILPEGILSSALPEFDSSTSVNISFTLEGNAPPRIYIPPGTPIEYFWELTDEAGNEVATQPVTVTYDDIRFDWKDTASGVINLHWYAGSDDFAQEMLAVASSTIDDLSSLLGAEVDFPIHVWVYGSVNDMRPALVRRSESFERQVITAGERVSENTVLVLGSSGAMDTLRHELTHIVTAVAGEGPFGSLPSWLDEGLAVYTQADPGGYRSALERAADRGNVFSIRAISSQPGDPSAVGLFYGQSWSVVSYLIDTYGPEQFAQLFATFKAGVTIDEALEAVYGFDVEGLDDEWRASLGLPPRERPPEEPEGQAVPTLLPSGPGPQPVLEEGGDGTPVGAIIGLVAGLLALAAVLGLGGYLIARRF